MSLNSLHILLAVTPILSLIILSLVANMETAAVASFLLTTVLFFVWANPLNTYFAALAVAAGVTINILFIIFGALFLFHTMQETGFLDRINRSLEAFHPSKEIRFFLLTFGLTGLIEGIAGFGTPAALVPFLLISMGFDPVLAISSVLLTGVMFVAFGAIGTPINIGLRSALQLPAMETSQIEMFVGAFMACAAIALLFFLIRGYERSHGKMKQHHKKQIIVLFFFFLIPYLVFAFTIPDLASILSTVVMLVASFFYLHHTERKIKLRAWIPYGSLIALLLLPKASPFIQRLLAKPITVPHLFSTNMIFSLAPLSSPLMAFLIVGIVLMFTCSCHPQTILKQTIRKSTTSLLLLFPIVAISQLMLHSDATFPSMIQYIARLFLLFGRDGYLIASPFIGMLGAFVSGSNTVSNLIFGSTQLEVARSTGLNSSIVLALQSAGGAIGSSICLFNILAACVVVNLKNSHTILKRNLIPALTACAIISLAGFVAMRFIS